MEQDRQGWQSHLFSVAPTDGVKRHEDLTPHVASQKNVTHDASAALGAVRLEEDRGMWAMGRRPIAHMPPDCSSCNPAWLFSFPLESRTHTPPSADISWESISHWD